MPRFSSKYEFKSVLLASHWVAVALSVSVFFVPVTSLVQATGGSEIVDLEQEVYSVEVAESARNERRRETPIGRVAQMSVATVKIKSSVSAQFRSRVSERDSLNGIGGWLRL